MAVADREATLERLATDALLYAPSLLKIVNKAGEDVPLVPRPGQLKIEAALQAQQQAGLPMRIIILKSRQVGSSTWGIGRLVQRCTLKRNRRALVVAQDNDTAGSLFDIGDQMYAHLPDDAPELKPELYQRQSSDGGRKLLHWGTKAKEARLRGDLGMNSWLRVDTAKEVSAGRGKTITDLLGSEVGHWPDPRKALSLMNAVPDLADTLVILESTANGRNFFKVRWDRAMRGEGDFTPVFISWLEDPDCCKAFRTDQDRIDFAETVGTGPYGADEAFLQKLGATFEQLHWRRSAIVDKAGGKLDEFKQEYPSTPEEAFIASGNHVFSISFIQQALHGAEAIEKLPARRGGPQQGIFEVTETKTRRVLGDIIEVPTKVEFKPREQTSLPDSHPWWTIWREPTRPPEDWRAQYEQGLVDLATMERGIERAMAGIPDQFVGGVDPAGDIDQVDGREDADTAYNAVEFIDHRTGDQVAEFRARLDHDQVAMEAFKAGLFFEEAWLGVEVTGGYGIAIASILWKRLGYRRLFTRQKMDGKKQTSSDRLGWSTDRKTKPLMEAGMAELLREGTHGIRSPGLALELTTYVKDERGRHGPDEESFSDRLLAYMQAQEIRRLKPLRQRRPTTAGRPNSMTRRLPWD